MTVSLTRIDRPAAGEDMLPPAIDADDPFAAELRFTDVFRRHHDAPVALREAYCLQAQFPEILCPIEPHDLLAGRIRPRRATRSTGRPARAAASACAPALMGRFGWSARR